MKRDFYSDGQGKGRLPLQPHPKNKTRAVYTEELTHLSTAEPHILQDSCSARKFPSSSSENQSCGQANQVVILCV